MDATRTHAARLRARRRAPRRGAPTATFLATVVVTTATLLILAHRAPGHAADGRPDADATSAADSARPRAPGVAVPELSTNPAGAAWVFADQAAGPFAERVSVAVSPAFPAGDGPGRRAVAVVVEGGPPPSVRARFGGFVDADGAAPVRFRRPAIQVEPIPATWGEARSPDDIAIRFLP